MQKENKNQLTSSRKVVIRDINALLQTAPISRIKTLRDDEGRSKNVGQALPDNKGCFLRPLREKVGVARGFTLIELLVVVLIIGILSAVALPQYQKAVAKSRYVQLQTAATAIANAEEVYYLGNGSYTSSRENLDIAVPTSSLMSSILLTVTNAGHAAVSVSNGKLTHTIYFKHHFVPNQADTSRCRVMQDINYLHDICKGLTGKSRGFSCSAAGSSNYCMDYQY